MVALDSKNSQTGGVTTNKNSCGLNYVSRTAASGPGIAFQQTIFAFLTDEAIFLKARNNRLALVNDDLERRFAMCRTGFN